MIAKYQTRPKPAAVEKREDGSELCNLKTAAGKREYDSRKKIMWLRQLRRCAICRKRITLEEAQFGHGRSRGMGGGFRDDRIWNVVGHPMNACLCGICNTTQGSKKYEWRDGMFQPAERHTCS